MSSNRLTVGGPQTNELFKGLKALSDTAFPKRCANCGAEYATAEDYIKKTEDLFGQSGLKKGYDDDDNPIVELFRNCVCGSTLMDCFNDRRDVTESGLKRRELFGKLIVLLESKGIETPIARKELIKVLRGEKSELLEKTGVGTLVR